MTKWWWRDSVEDLDQAGIYGMSTPGAGDSVPALAVNMRRDESNLAPLDPTGISDMLGFRRVEISRDLEGLLEQIEESRIMRGFFGRIGQPLMQDWMVEMVKRMLRHLPVGMLARMGLATLVAPSTSGWSRARDAIREYADEQHAKQRRALGLEELVETARQDAGAPARS